MLYRTSILLLAISLSYAIANGQQAEPFEGFIAGIRANAVKGVVSYQRQGGKFPLESGLKLEQNDFIRSSAGAYAELLLQPGNFLRVGGETEFQIFSDQYDKIRLKLNNGTINLEMLSRETTYSWFQMEQATELIRVITPDAEVFINHPGVFRISTTPSGRTEVVVREGEAVMNGHRIKKKKRAAVANGNVTFAEIDTRVEDNFDTWSRERAEQLVRENRTLKKEAPWVKSIKRGDVEIEVPGEEQYDNTRGRVISARPGSVNFVEAGVEFSRGDKKWEPLTEKSQLEAGNKLRTAAYSLVELILLPDMHLRIAASSEVLFDALSTDSISLKVLRGSAILDVARFDRKLGSQIRIGGSSTSAVINDSGNYRVDARGDGNTIAVREGKVLFNERGVGSCKIIQSTTISECEKKPTDNFDFWSQHRGEGELYNGRVTLAMVTHLTRLRRYRFRNTGFWYQHPGQTSYTFVPYTSQAFRSPYGGNYSTVLATRSSINRTDNDGNPSGRRRRPEVMRPSPILRRDP